MSRNYYLNTDAAKQADQMGNRITETGKYVGVIVSAEAVTSKKGSDGVELSFKDDNGATADFLTLWTHNKDGKELFSFKTLNALMTCCEVKALETAQGEVTKWDADSNSRIKQKATVYPTLQGKRVGLLLQKAEYEKGDGSIGTKMEIALPFNAATERTASEVLAKAQKAEKMAQVLAILKDRPLQKRKDSAPAAQGQHAPGAGSFADDDIPFAPLHWKEML
jgi:hypothetical protein